jgi:hypothetical protein
MSVLQYVHLDVFTNQPFTGIQLGKSSAPPGRREQSEGRAHLALFGVHDGRARHQSLTANRTDAHTQVNNYEAPSGPQQRKLDKRNA